MKKKQEKVAFIIGNIQFVQDMIELSGFDNLITILKKTLANQHEILLVNIIYIATFIPEFTTSNIDVNNSIYQKCFTNINKVRDLYGVDVGSTITKLKTLFENNMLTFVAKIDPTLTFDQGDNSIYKFKALITSNYNQETELYKQVGMTINNVLATVNTKIYNNKLSGIGNMTSPQEIVTDMTTLELLRNISKTEINNYFIAFINRLLDMDTTAMLNSAGIIRICDICLHSGVTPQNIIKFIEMVMYRIIHSGAIFTDKHRYISSMLYLDEHSSIYTIRKIILYYHIGYLGNHPTCVDALSMYKIESTDEHIALEKYLVKLLTT